MTIPESIFSRICISLAFLGSAFLLPWWATAIFAVIMLSYWQSYGVVVAGGVFMDLVFGGGNSISVFPFLYTTVFSFLALLSWFLHRNMLG